MIANDAARALSLTDAVLTRALGVSSLSELPERLREEVQIDEGRRWLDVRVDPIQDRWGTLAGRLVVARDVTLQKELEDEREQLIDELQDALHKVVQLEGLLPICASCRKVRDDTGYWGNVEEYFRSRAPVEFTYGICPDCQVTLYPSTPWQPVVKVRLHSTSDASSRSALLLPHIQVVFSIVAPCPRDVSPHSSRCAAGLSPRTAKA
jgi:hypothetical protein